MLDYASRAYAETQLVALIEHPRAIENIDEILAVEGLGGAIAAPFDLAVNMGFTDGPNQPEVQEALAHVSKKIAAKGFPLTSFAASHTSASVGAGRPWSATIQSVSKKLFMDPIRLTATRSNAGRRVAGWAAGCKLPNTAPSWDCRAFGGRSLSRNGQRQWFGSV
jgi:hypothetical protein